MVIITVIMVIIMVIIMIIMVIITVILVGRVRCGEVRLGGMRVMMGSKTWREGGSRNNIIINSTQKSKLRSIELTEHDERSSY